MRGCVVDSHSLKWVTPAGVHDVLVARELVRYVLVLPCFRRRPSCEIMVTFGTTRWRQTKMVDCPVVLLDRYTRSGSAAWTVPHLDRDGAGCCCRVVCSAGQRDDLAATGHLLQIIYRNEGVAEKLPWVSRKTNRHVRPVKFSEIAKLEICVT